MSQKSKTSILANCYLANCYSGASEEYLSSEAVKDIEDHVSNRYNSCLEYIIPWVKSKFDIKNKTILEIGCGTGSITAAFAHFAKKIYAYDIREDYLNVAQKRFEILGLNNAIFFLTNPDSLIKDLDKNHSSESVDIVLFYAVLEHQKVFERIETLKKTWALLKPGGIMVIVESPNRLHYRDRHTSQLPFFHMLPNELALLYYEKSPRKDFKDTISQALSKSKEHANDKLDRLGRGVSFHEFEIVFGELLSYIIIGDGYDAELIKYKGKENMEEILLQTAIIKYNLKVHRGFSRNDLDLILRKPKDGEALIINNPALPFKLFRKIFRQYFFLSFLSTQIYQALCYRWNLFQTKFKRLFDAL